MAAEPTAPVKADYTLPLQPMARLLDLQPRRVQQLADEGVIVKAGRGKYDVVGSVQGYIKYLRKRAAGEELGGEAFNLARARNTAAKADIATMERDRLLGLYLRTEEVTMTWSAIVTTVRTRLLSIPAKLGARLAAAKTALAAQEIVAAEIHDALNEFSKQSVTAMPGTHGGSGHAGAAAVRATAEANN
jgi:phage terminase Nu1 subunit (DNA packaging protein)